MSLVLTVPLMIIAVALAFGKLISWLANADVRRERALKVRLRANVVKWRD